MHFVQCGIRYLNLDRIVFIECPNRGDEVRIYFSSASDLLDVLVVPEKEATALLEVIRLSAFRTSYDAFTGKT